MNTKKVIFLTAVIVILGSVIVPALADWSAPEDGPPTCNVNDPGCAAPINVSGSPQTKTGTLTLGSGLFTGGTVQTGSVVSSPPNPQNLIVTGNLGIGGVFDRLRSPITEVPTAPLDVDGYVRIRSGYQALAPRATFPYGWPSDGRVLTAKDTDGNAYWADPLITPPASVFWSETFQASGNTIYRNSPVAIGPYTAAPPSTNLLSLDATGKSYGIYASGATDTGIRSEVSASSAVAGVDGVNLRLNGSARGVSGSTISSSGYGVYGVNLNTTGGVGTYGTGFYGVQGISAATGADSAGVYGQSTAPAGKYGVYGKSSNAGGTGVYGTGAAYGVQGVSVGSSARGVYGPKTRQTDQASTALVIAVKECMV